MWECKFLMIIKDNFFNLSPSNGVESRHIYWKVSTCSLESFDMFIGKSRHVPWKVSTCSLESLDMFIGKPRHIPWKVSICSLESLDIFIGKSKAKLNSSQRWFIKRRFAGYDFHHHLGHHMILFVCFIIFEAM